MSTALELFYSVCIVAALLMLYSAFLCFCDWIDERKEYKLTGTLREFCSRPATPQKCMSFEELYTEIAAGDYSEPEHWTV